MEDCKSFIFCKGDHPLVVYLTKKELELRSKLVDLGYLKIVLPPYTEIEENVIKEWVDLEILTLGEPIYIYFDYNETRKNKFLPKNQLIGNWQFKMFLAKNPRMDWAIEMIKKFPCCKDCISDKGLNIKKLKQKNKIEHSVHEMRGGVQEEHPHAYLAKDYENENIGREIYGC